MVRNIVALALFAVLTACKGGDVTAPAPTTSTHWVAAVSTDWANPQGSMYALLTKSSSIDSTTGSFSGFNPSLYNTSYIELRGDERFIIATADVGYQATGKSFAISSAVQQDGDALVINRSVGFIHETVLRYRGAAPDGSPLYDFVSERGLKQFGAVLSNSAKFTLGSSSSSFSQLDFGSGIEASCNSVAKQGRSYLRLSVPEINFVTNDGRNLVYNLSGPRLLMVECYKYEDAPSKVLDALQATNFRILASRTAIWRQ